MVNPIANQVWQDANQLCLGLSGVFAIPCWSGLNWPWADWLLIRKEARVMPISGPLCCLLFACASLQISKWPQAMRDSLIDGGKFPPSLAIKNEVQTVLHIDITK